MSDFEFQKKFKLVCHAFSLHLQNQNRERDEIASLNEKIRVLESEAKNKDRMISQIMSEVQIQRD